MRLHQHYEDFAHWQAAKIYAETWYGPHAASVKVFFEGEYNDEGGTSYHVDDVTVTDAEGSELDYDLTLPAWQERMQDEKWESHFDEVAGVKTFDPDYDKGWFFEDGYAAFRKMSPEGDTLSFDLTTPPAELPHIYVEEPAAE